MTRPLSHITSLWASLVVATMVTIAPAAMAADRHHDSGRGGSHSEHHGAPFHHPHSSFGLFFGAPAVVVPPPVYYTPAYPDYPPYPYAPVPISGFYWTAYGYCRDFQTAIGVETACQQPDGVWRFIN